MVPAEQVGRNIFSQAVTALLTWKIIEGYKFPVQFLVTKLSLWKLFATGGDLVLPH